MVVYLLFARIKERGLNYRGNPTITWNVNVVWDEYPDGNFNCTYNLFINRLEYISNNKKTMDFYNFQDIPNKYSNGFVFDYSDGPIIKRVSRFWAWWKCRPLYLHMKEVGVKGVDLEILKHGKARISFLGAESPVFHVGEIK